MFRILALDGGGYRGIFAAHILKRIEEEFSIKWCETFNMISGTSTGSIIAAGLVAGIPAARIAEMYKELGSKVFKGSIIRKGLFASKYSKEELQRSLDSILGDKKLGDFSFPLIIPATNITQGSVHVFKTQYDPGFYRDKGILLRDAVMASCSAPTYFNPHNVASTLVADGGLWANNPSLVALIDAKARLGVALDDVRILSIGTGVSDVIYSHVKAKRNALGWGLIGKWRGARFVQLMLNLQSSSMENMTGLLLKREQIIRINMKLSEKMQLDDTSVHDDLISGAEKVFSEKSAEIRDFIRGSYD